MCKCKNIEIGSHKATASVLAPEWSSRKYISIDSCLVNEIRALWNCGVHTANCCCGHNVLPPSIMVYPESIDKMLDLGYKKIGACEFRSKSIK